MKKFAAVFIILLGFNQPAFAQSVVQNPVCFKVINEAPYKVFGDFLTDFYTAPDGTRARHRANFRLAAKDTIDEKEGYPLDRAEFCSRGPFFEGRKLDMTVRTLVPIFSCKTAIDRGPIVIKGSVDPDGTTETTAECYN